MDIRAVEPSHMTSSWQTDQSGTEPEQHPASSFYHSLQSSPLNQRLRTIHGLRVVYSASNILDIFHSQHTIDHRCLGRLRKYNWNRPFQQSLRCHHQTRKFSRGYPRAAPRTREGIQGLSGRKSQTHQLSQPGGKCHPGVLGHSRRGGRLGKSYGRSGNF